MTDKTTVPPRRPGLTWLTEGGIETEIMYKWGFDLPHFAMFPLLEKVDARDAIRGMYRRYLDTVASHRMGALIGGFDYRASPDWGKLLGYSPQGLAEANIAAIAFLQELAAEYIGQIADTCIVGYLGPRGDAYRLNRTISEDEAFEYHSVQMATLKRAGADLAWAVTFNNPVEARGVVRAARLHEMPVAVSFSLSANSRLASGATLASAIEDLDQASGGYPEFYALNCSHPVEFEPALEAGAWQQRLRCIRPNAAKMDKIALCKLGHLEEGDPEELGRQMADVSVRLPHMDIWGGCCGTCETHLDQIARRLAEVGRLAA